MRVYLCIPHKKGVLQKRVLDLPEGSTAADALAAAGLPRDTVCGLFCEKVSAQTVLSPEDRIDVAVDLAMDPMQVRRLRAQNKERTAVPRPRHGGIHQLIKPLEEAEI